MSRDRSPFTLRAALGRQKILVCALVILTVIIAIGASGRAPLAGTLLAVELVVLAGLRASLSAQAVGALAVRQRPVDVTVLLVLAAGLFAVVGVPNL